MLRNLIVLAIVLLAATAVSPSAVLANSEQENKIDKLNWDNLEVVWLEDQRFPTYDLAIYFADGAMSDEPSRWGETELMFSELQAGTNRYNQKQISDALEFYGISMAANVSHEYTVLTISGLVKDIIPTMKMVCHLFNNSVFPEDELNRDIGRVKSSLNNIVTSPSALAERAFRQLSLEGTPYASPTGGTLKTLGKISSVHLQNKLSYFNKQVKKRLYISGPKEIQVIKGMLVNECGWDLKEANFVRKIDPAKLKIAEKKSSNPKVILIPTPKANQAQIRIGRYLPLADIADHDLLAVTSGFMGGGFTSLLMQELRVKRGLTYSVGAFAAPQRDYGRAVISTFTKNETLNESLKVIEDVVKKVGRSDFSKEDLKKSVNYLSGRYLFGFEKNSAYLTNLLFFDHVGRAYSELYDFPKKILSFQVEDIAQTTSKVFAWDKQVIVVIGDPSLESALKKNFKNVKIRKYQDFL